MKRRPRRRNVRKDLTILLFMSPWIVGFLGFILYPMLATLYYSFMRYDLLSNPEPYGIQNYVYMFTKDPNFWVAVRNTIWIIAWGLPLQIALAILTAWMLTKPKKGVKTYRTIFFMPSLAPPVAVALAFVFIFNPATGPINVLLSNLGWRNPPLWFFSPEWSKPAMLILGLWGIGSTMIIFLAGLLDVPRQLYEAADIEGASGWQKFRHVTLPTISPVIFFNLVTGVIYGFQFFTQAYVASITVSGSTTSQAATSVGDPNRSLMFYSVYLWQQGWGNFRMGYASALAWMLFLITMVCTLVLVRTSRRWVHYAGGGFR
jgi:multiple sugar transport system permease protein